MFDNKIRLPELFKNNINENIFITFNGIKNN